MKQLLLFISAALAIFGFSVFIYILANNQCTNQYIYLLLSSIFGATLFLFLPNLKKKISQKNHEKNKKAFYNNQVPPPRYKPAIIKYN
jgi:hypothetical protein